MKAKILGVLTLLAVLPNSSLAAMNYSSHKAARIEFGSLDSQIGVSWVDDTRPNTEGLRNEGVRGITVDSSGNIYIGDYVNGKVKKFSGSGQLLAATAEARDNIQAFEIDKQGNIYVHNEGQDSRVTKFTAEGKLVWSYSSAEIFSRSLLSKTENDLDIELLPGFGGGLTAISDGSIVVELKGWGRGTNKPRSVGLVLSPDGKMIKALPVFGTCCCGMLLSYKSSGTDGEPPSSVEAMLYGTDGLLVKQFALGNATEHKTNYAGVRFGVSAILCDQQGGLITVSYARSSNPVKVSPAAIIGKDVLLNRYDTDGKFITHLRLHGSPFKGIASNIAVGPNGSVYHLVFDKKGVDIMRYELVR